MKILRKRCQRLPHGAIVIALFVAGSCSEGDKVDPNLRLLDKEDYFPLHSGDNWELAFEPRRSIELTRTFNDLDYYGMVSDDDTTYYRKTTDGKVYERRSTTEEILRFDLSADVGQTWTFKTNGFDESWNATLVSKDDTVNIGDHKFFNCYQFWFDIPEWADEEQAIWLAPGIGFIKEYYPGGTGDRIILKKATINGVSLEF